MANALCSDEVFNDSPIKEGVIDPGASYHMGGDRDFLEMLGRF